MKLDELKGGKLRAKKLKRTFFLQLTQAILSSFHLLRHVESTLTVESRRNISYGSKLTGNISRGGEIIFNHLLVDLRGGYKVMVNMQSRVSSSSSSTLYYYFIVHLIDLSKLFGYRVSPGNLKSYYSSQFPCYFYFYFCKFYLYTWFFLLGFEGFYLFFIIIIIVIVKENIIILRYIFS